MLVFGDLDVSSDVRYRVGSMGVVGGVIVFPVTAAGVMVLVQISGEIRFKHRLSLWGRAGTAAPIVLLTV